MKNCYPDLQNSGPNSLSVPDLLHAYRGWLLHGEIAGWSRRTLGDRREWFDRLTEFLSSREFTFSVDGLRAFFHALGHGGDSHSRKPLSPASMKHAHVIVKAFGNWCIAEGLLAVNPMQRIPSPVLKDDGIEPFTNEELERIREAAKNSRQPERDIALVDFLADTGIRASELAALRRRDVDPTARTAQVRNGKGGKSRVISFGASTAQALWRYAKTDKNAEPEDYLFVSERGGPMTRSSLLQLCRRLGRAAGVRNVHTHRFRHDCAVRLLRGGAHVFGVMSQLGHSRVSTTGIYVKLAERDVREMQRTASPIDNLRKNLRK